MILKRMQHNGTFIFSFSIINSNNFNMGREIMTKVCIYTKCYNRMKKLGLIDYTYKGEK
jgi:hypothetical protein